MTGTFVTIDGPGGSGKTAAAAALTCLLRSRGYPVWATAEPSPGPVGALTRTLVNEVKGHALACLVAADRYHHLDAEIRPQRAAGHIVVCDRYLASTLVLQARDGLDPAWLLGLNTAIDPPDLAVILTAEPGVISARLNQRGRHDRFEESPAPAMAEAGMYRDAAGALAGLGVSVTQIDTSRLTPLQVAGQISNALATCCASLSEHG